MAQKLKLNTEHNKFRIRLHVIVLIVIILASLAIGFTAGQKGIFTGMAAKNCISQKDFQFFIDDANEVTSDYQQCVADLWNLQLSYKIAAAKSQKAGNSTG